MKITEAIDQFLTAIEADGVSAATVRWHRSILRRYAAAQPPRDVESISAPSVRNYINALRRSDYSDDTIYGHIRSLHRFWKWCSVEYGIKNPMQNIAYPKQPESTEPKAADHSDVDKLIATAGHGAAGRRDRAIIAFLVDTGCRAGGLVRLHWKDIDLDRRRAYVVEKGKKRRAVFFSVETRAYLTDLFYGRNTRAETVFYNIRTCKPLTVSGLYQILRKIARKAKITGRANPHAFRHAFGIAFMEDDGDSMMLAKIMGHSSVEVTAKRYAIFGANDLARHYDRHAPMPKIQKAKRSS